MSRPTSQHRLSVSSASPNVPPRINSSSRAQSHTTSLGSMNSAHRIGRRKSSNFSPVPKPTVVDGQGGANRRSSASRSALASLNDAGAFPSMPTSLPHHSSVLDASSSSNATVIVDGPPLSSFPDKAKLKMRRASDGTRLTKKEKAAAGDLKCDHCGKSYKHGSCLNKHLWEHTPQWQYTSKLLISKHQQVQLLEAASVLVAMNQDGSNDSDSSSPGASGSSDLRDEDLSSTETTPPPTSDGPHRDSKRYSNNSSSSAYSRSYQSVFSSASVPNSEPSFVHRRQWSSSSASRPLTANPAISGRYQDEDPQDLAAAVGLLSCSYGTPKTGPTTMPMDVPPVPPLPAKYLAQKAPSQDDVVMDDDDVSDGEAPTRADDVEYGVFGKMDAWQA